jgi:hypothetical protein
LLRFFLKLFVNGYPSCYCSRGFFSSFMQMGSHIIFLLKNSSSQILYKLVPMSFFFKIFVKLQVVDPTHEQIKFVWSLIKSTQVWSSIEKKNLWINPFPTNPTNSNQLSLKLWLEINCALEFSWKYLNNHVWWCCVKLYLCVLLVCLWWIACKVQWEWEISNVKVMDESC